MQVSIIASVWSNAAIKLLQGLGNLFWLQVTARNHIFEQRLGHWVAVVNCGFIACVMAATNALPVSRCLYSCQV